MKKKYSFLLLTVLALFFSRQAKAQCAASFTYITNADTVYFTDASTAGFGSIVTWGWSFGDGTFSTTQNPTHVYTACGIYNVSLTIFTSAFCSNTYNSSVTVSGGITPSFTYTVDTTSGNVQFQPQPLGLNLNYIWAFGDSTFDSTAAPNHTYPPGTYNVCLTVYDNDSICTATICDSVTVYISPASCSTSFTYTDNGSGNISFQAAPFSFGLTYSWDFGDASTGTGGFTFHTYPTAGTYYACLTAVDSATMCTSSYCDTIVLTADSTACNVSFNYFDNNGMVGFSATPLTASNTYVWDFGDGNSGTGAATSNTYSASGFYYACVTMTDGFNGCSDSFCDSVNVSITGIAEDAANTLHLSVFPNPASDQASIGYYLVHGSDVVIDIYDLSGRTIEHIIRSENSGKHELLLDCSSFSKGAYMIRLSVETGSTSRLLIRN